MRKLIRGLYARLVPAPVQEKLSVYAKAFIGASGSIVQIVNLTVPDYGDEAKAIVSGVVAVATFLGIVAKSNATKREAKARVAARRRAA